MADLSPSSDTDARASQRPKPGKLDIGRLKNSFGYAFQGLAYVWRSQQNFRIECLIAVLAIVFGALFEVALVPILLCCALVLSLEAFNSALESVVDLVSPEQHLLAKQAKDAAAAAVLIASLLSALIGLMLFVPALWRWIGDRL